MLPPQLYQSDPLSCDRGGLRLGFVQELTLGHKERTKMCMVGSGIKWQQTAGITIYVD